MYRLTDILHRAKRIYASEGMLSLFRRVTSFAISRVFIYQIYYHRANVNQIYQMFNEADIKPRIDNFSSKIISSNREADELESQGFEFRSCALNSRERLNRGAIAFCIFVDTELATIGWLTTSQQAMDSLHEPFIKVEFTNGEAYIGDAWTNPKYRRLRLHAYNRVIRMGYAYHHGIRLTRYAVLVSNFAPQVANQQFGDITFGRGRFLKILWWKSWKEKPVTP